MPQQATFGRRVAPAQPPARPPFDPNRLSPEAEAFRAAIGDGHGGELDDFAQWRRAQRPRRVLVIALGVAFMAPGLLCFLVQAPWEASIAFSLAGVAVNGWLRRERQRQAREIAQWTPPGVPF